jgi:hypothetical protein
MLHTIILIAIVLLLLHLAGGAFRHRQHYIEHEEHPALSYVWGRGWFASVRVPVIGGRYDHHVSLSRLILAVFTVTAGLVIAVVVLAH